MSDYSTVLRQARRHSSFTQSELAERMGTSQSTIASLEGGDGNPTVETLARYAEAAGFALSFSLQPLPVSDPVVERYKRDVDRTLLRDNLRKSVDERLRTLAEWQEAGRVLEQATALAKRAGKRAR
jgi:transcriptional regulator with XRE-family HTH domain